MRPRSQAFWIDLMRSIQTNPTPYLSLVPQLLAFYYYYLVIYILTPFLVGMRVFSWLPHNDTEKSCRTKGEVEMWSWGKNKIAFKHWTPTWTLTLSNWELSWGWVGVWVESRVGHLWNTLVLGNNKQCRLIAGVIRDCLLIQTQFHQALYRGNPPGSCVFFRKGWSRGYIEPTTTVIKPKTWSWECHIR